MAEVQGSIMELMSKRVQGLRVLKGWTNRDLVAAIENQKETDKARYGTIDEATLQRLLDGEEPWRLDQASAVATALGVSLHLIIYEQDPDAEVPEVAAKAYDLLESAARITRFAPERDQD